MLNIVYDMIRCSCSRRADARIRTAYTQPAHQLTSSTQRSAKPNPNFAFNEFTFGIILMIKVLSFRPSSNNFPFNLQTAPAIIQCHCHYYMSTTQY